MTQQEELRYKAGMTVRCIAHTGDPSFWADNKTPDIGQECVIIENIGRTPRTNDEICRLEGYSEGIICYEMRDFEPIQPNELSINNETLPK